MAAASTSGVRAPAGSGGANVSATSGNNASARIATLLGQPHRIISNVIGSLFCTVLRVFRR
jgi:hypothetical protein